MKITIGEFKHRWGMTDSNCEIVGLNPWCLNEGRATKEDVLYINSEQAEKLGISEYEFEQRSK